MFLRVMFACTRSSILMTLSHQSRCIFCPRCHGSLDEQTQLVLVCFRSSSILTATSLNSSASSKTTDYYTICTWIIYSYTVITQKIMTSARINQNRIVLALIKCQIHHDVIAICLELWHNVHQDCARG